LHLLQSFVKRQVRDTAEEVPRDYAPPDFTTAALQHTNVKLTWDADDDTRKKALRKKMTEDSIRDDDFKVSFAAERPVASASTVVELMFRVINSLNMSVCPKNELYQPWRPLVFDDKQGHSTKCS